MPIQFVKRGDIVVSKKQLKAHCNVIRHVLRTMDELMKQPATVERGKKIAAQMNLLDNSRQAIEHFLLDIPLKDTSLNKRL